MIILEIRSPASPEARMVSSESQIITIGRHSSNEIQISDDSASRFHAEIEHRPNGYYVRDLDSRNGLLVNNAPVLEHHLHDGDEIRIGQTRLAFHHATDANVVSDNERTLVLMLPDRKRAAEEAHPQFSEAMEMPGPGILAERFLEDYQREKNPRAGAQEAKSSDDMVVLAARLGQILAGAAEVDDLLSKMFALLETEVPFNRGAVLLWSGGKQSDVPRATRILSPGDGGKREISLSTTIVNHCLEKSQGICCMDAMSDPRFAEASSVHDLQLKSLICVPIPGAQQMIGVLHIESPSVSRAFGAADLRKTMLAANLMGPSLQAMLTREERRRRERGAEQVRAIAAAAHCFENMLLISDAQIEMLHEAAVKGNTLLVAAMIDEIARSRSALAASLGALARYLRGGVQPFKRVQINELLASLLDEMAPALETLRIEMDFEPGDAQAPSYLDAQALRQALLNVLRNAIEAIGETSQARQIRVTASQEEGTRIRIAIEDSGEGMTADTRERAFEPFFSTRGANHAGLGLAYARHIINAMGGSIDLISEPGKGTTALILLPLRTDPPSTPPRDMSSVPWMR